MPYFCRQQKSRAMKYKFNFENREKPIQFNREKLLLSALQESEQLYYMMDTQYEGIYQAEALERRRLYGTNTFRSTLAKSRYKFLSDRKEKISEAFAALDRQKISVFRKGMHFYSEVAYQDLVPGDVIFLSGGDIVPSDIRIVFSRDLEVDPSIYTGEELTVRKTTTYHDGRTALDHITDIPNICFVGTTVVCGMARGVVVSTGKATYLSHLLLM